MLLVINLEDLWEIVDKQRRLENARRCSYQKQVFHWKTWVS